MFDTDLDEAQLRAVEHGDGPLVVLAGAGTGKTRTLTARVAALIRRGVPAERILLLTFSRRAAEDMLARALAVLGGADGERRPTGGTFHAVAHRTVSGCAGALGLADGFSVLDAGDAADLLDLMRERHGLGGGDVRVPRPATLVDVYSRCVSTGRPVREVVTAEFGWCAPHLPAIADLFAEFVARKRADRLLDFDDLLLAWRALLADPATGPRLRGRYDHVLVDEYQDVNRAQVDIVRLLRPDGRGLTVVGDDAQAIYGFRGADGAHLPALAEEVAGATVVRLERSHRAGASLLALANAVRPVRPGGALHLHGGRPAGPRPRLVHCYDAAGEARAVADAVLAAADRGHRLRDQAVLCRAGSHGDLVEVELATRRIPYRKYGGLRFLAAAHVRDLVAAVRLLDNPADEVAWFRLLRLHPGVGAARGRRLLAELAPAEAAAPAEQAAAAARTVAAAPAGTRTLLDATLRGVAAARSAGAPAEQATAVLDVLRPLLSRRYPDAGPRLADLDRLVAEAGADLAGLGVALTLDPPRSSGVTAEEAAVDEDYLVLSTVHSAKGLEWPVVHLVHLVDGAFPSDLSVGTPAALAEEARLFYVAVTRARDELNLYCPARLPHHRHAGDDRHSLAPPSRFLDGRALAALDVVPLPRPGRRGRGGDDEPGGTVRLPDLADLWR